MTPAIAKVPDDNNSLESIGRATLQIVHDLKNQLNGLKLYATYLRKRLERDDQIPEERETLGKLIAGLDRAAKDMTALVRYAQPITLRKQPRVDLTRTVAAVASQMSARDTGALPHLKISPDMDAAPLLGEFDGIALAEALEAITYDISAALKSKEAAAVSIRVRREKNGETAEALIEWPGAARLPRQNSFANSIGCGTVHSAVGARIIEAHGGRVKCEGDFIRAWLPLTESQR